MTHHQMSPTIERPMKAIPVMALSAIGSAILPKSVIRLCLRARSPSILSVIIATAKIPNAIQRHITESPPSWSSAQPKAGTMAMRSTVRMLAMFQLDTWLCSVVIRGSLPRSRSTPSVASHRRGDEVTHAGAVGTGQQCRTVHLGALVGGASLDLAVLHRLHEHDHLLADALLGPLGVELLDQGGDVLGAGADLVLVQLEVIDEAGGLGAVLVGVAEDAGHVHPGGLEEVAQGLQVLVGLAREADDHVGPYAGQRGQRADLVEQAQEALRVAEAAHPAQHGGTGVLEGQVEVGHDARGRGDRLDQARPRLGGLEVGHPDPLDPVDAAELGEHGLEQAQVAEVLAVGRGVLADQEQLA